MTCMACILDFLTLIWCVTQQCFKSCICVKYKVNLSNRHGAMKWTQHNFLLAYVALTFDLKIYMPHAFHKMNVWWWWVSWSLGDRNMVKNLWQPDRWTDRSADRQRQWYNCLLQVKNGCWNLAEPCSNSSNRIWNSIKCSRKYSEHRMKKMKDIV